MKKGELAEWLVGRVEQLESFPTYNEALGIVREMEDLEGYWYGWLLERKRVELVAKVYRLIKK